MQPKEILKEHIAKTASLSDDQFDYFFSHFKHQSYKKGQVIIDRTRYGMKFRSGNFFKDLGDNLIYNDFELNVSVTAKAG